MVRITSLHKKREDQGVGTAGCRGGFCCTLSVGISVGILVAARLRWEKYDRPAPAPVRCGLTSLYSRLLLQPRNRLALNPTRLNPATARGSGSYSSGEHSEDLYWAFEPYSRHNETSDGPPAQPSNCPWVGILLLWRTFGAPLLGLRFL